MKRLLRKAALNLLSVWKKARYGLRQDKFFIRIGRGAIIREPKRIKINGAIRIQQYVTLNPSYNGEIHIGNNVDIGQFSTISANNLVEIENDVIIAPNALITDHNHEYQDVTLPVWKQGMRERNATVKIGGGSWLGANVVIIGNVSIGKHCVIGANSVVNKDIPDYSVAVGNPAGVVKKYNAALQEWERVQR